MEETSYCVSTDRKVMYTHGQTLGSFSAYPKQANGGNYNSNSAKCKINYFHVKKN